MTTVPFTVRLPDDLHARLTGLAEGESRSAGNLLVVLLKEALAEREERMPKVVKMPAKDLKKIEHVKPPEAA